MVKNKANFVVIISLIIAFLFIDSTISVGLAFGYLCSLVHFRLIEIQFGRICRGETGGLFLYGGYFLRMALLAAPIIISVLYPMYSHWAGVVVGLVFNKFSLFITHIRSSIAKG